jgi:hypothetical protein
MCVSSKLIKRRTFEIEGIRYLLVVVSRVAQKSSFSLIPLECSSWVATNDEIALPKMVEVSGVLLVT